MKPKRMIRKDRKPLLLDAALLAAEKYGFNNYTRENITEFSNVSPSLINAYFKNKKHIDRAVMRLAIKREVLTVIAQGLTSGDRIAVTCDYDLACQALDAISVEVLK